MAEEAGATVGVTAQARTVVAASNDDAKVHNAQMQSAQMHRCTNAQMQCTDAQIHKYTNAQMHKCQKQTHRLSIAWFILSELVVARSGDSWEDEPFHIVDCHFGLHHEYPRRVHIHRQHCQSFVFVKANVIGCGIEFGIGIGIGSGFACCLKDLKVFMHLRKVHQNMCVQLVEGFFFD